jgi:hypothetical protein
LICPYVVCQEVCLKVYTTAMLINNWKAEIINTAMETVEKVQICHFA